MASTFLNMNRVVQQFDYTDVGELEAALSLLIVVPDTSIATTKEHLRLIKAYAGNYSLPSWTLSNAEILATGFRDMIVILTEPTDKADTLPFEPMMEGSRTIRSLDRALQWASKGQRSVQNTIILDGRLLRSRAFQQRESRSLRRHRDSQGFGVIDDICKLVEPSVVLVCNCCRFETLNSRTTDLLVSRIPEAGNIEMLTWPSGAQGSIVKSFHPEFIYKCEQPDQRALRESLWKLTIATATNIILKSNLRGSGISKLRSTVLRGMDTFAESRRNGQNTQGTSKAGTLRGRIGR
ncbi:uncharacterized protein PV06_06493 [Exophiala oligosperma]|uniref:Uncharacterized protein n=1 Tax=Exophiala oligosperma TaxID=215243 RepID=A0A0D2DEJ5_9EURO|nr:uncharacterized protein PV06_06493 [Exophiala oligosperma]KIW40880.1 hypothetical protein PV06_06493 [Exophiala oligosperma]